MMVVLGSTLEVMLCVAVVILLAGMVACLGAAMGLWPLVGLGNRNSVERAERALEGLAVCSVLVFLAGLNAALLLQA